MKPLLLILFLALSACAAPHHTPLPAHAAEPSPSAPISGEYIATIRAPLVGEVSGRLTAFPHKDGFTALTRRNIAWSMIGGLEGLFGPLFVRSIFPDGVILVWVSSNPETGPDAKPGEGYIGPGESRRMQVRTRMASPEDPVEVFSPDGRRLATVTLRRPGPSEPATDYTALAAGVERAIALRLYDARLAQSSSVRAYLRHLTSNARAARDDIEFIFGAVMAARAHVSFALPLVFRELDPNWQTQLADLSTITTEFDEVTRIATLKADAFLAASEVDKAFAHLLAKHPRGILIDLSNCPGITLASLRVASWVIDRPIDAGTFLGPAARDAVKSGRLDGLTELNLDTAESVGTIERTLDAGGSAPARITITPTEHHFSGPVAILTSKRTTTSAESLAWALKSHAAGPTSDDRFHLFGQSTAGRPTLSRPVDIGSGWVAWVPALDYLPPVPFASDPTTKGCRPPDETSNIGRARRAALDWLRKEPS
jgi:hypothetical protein